jgi:hypothetical protein
VDSAISTGSFITTNTTQTITGQKTFNNASNTYSGSGANLSGVVLTGVVNQTVGGDKTLTGNLYTDAGLFGRNDAFAFNTYTGRMPIGYCWETLTLTTKPVTNTALTTNATIGLTKGVWQVTGYLWLFRSNGTFLVNSSISVVYPAVAGLKIYPNSAGLQFNIPHTNTNAVAQLIPVGTFTIVCTGSGLPAQTVERTINMTVGTNTTWYITFSGVKIA